MYIYIYIYIYIAICFIRPTRKKISKSQFRRSDYKRGTPLIKELNVYNGTHDECST